MSPIDQSLAPNAQFPDPQKDLRLHVDAPVRANQQGAVGCLGLQACPVIGLNADFAAESRENRHDALRLQAQLHIRPGDFALEVADLGIETLFKNQI